MAQELMRAIEQVSKEKGIDKNVLIETVEAAILSASRKRFKSMDNLIAKFNTDSGEVELFQKRLVVSEVTDTDREILLAEAENLFHNVQLNEEVNCKVTVAEDFGRIAAQTAKQVIVQRMREAERDSIQQEFKKREGELVNGIVQRIEGRNIIINLGRTDAILPYSEQVPKEVYKRGDRVRAYLLEVSRTNRGPQILLTRTHPGMVVCLFKLEVPEINEGILEIKGTVREPGYRTKIAIYSYDHNVDPVGTCVGMRGSRVQAIVRELEGEKIDIIKWNEDPTIFAANALSPAQITRISKTGPDSLEVVVADDQLSLAIGKRGQNVRLAARLTGWKIDIKSLSDVQKERAVMEKNQQVKALMNLPGIGEKSAEQLVDANFYTVHDIARASEDALMLIPGMGSKKALKLIEDAQNIIQESREEG